MDFKTITLQTFFAWFITFFDPLTNWVFVVSYTLELSVVFISKNARQALVQHIGECIVSIININNAIKEPICGYQFYNTNQI